MELIWVTDPHFELLHENAPFLFGKEIQSKGDALVITGDIANFNLLELTLFKLADGFQKPIYFVLGNHDFYYGSFDQVNKRMKNLQQKLNKNRLYWLDSGSISLSTDTAIYGSGGWYDARIGFPHRLDMSDFELITDFKNQLKTEIITISQSRADQLTAIASAELRKLAAQYKKIIFATHVPPFSSNQDKNWSPWFTNISLGNALLTIASEFSQTLFVIICGHTHRHQIIKPSHNLICYIGSADYYQPNIFNIIEIK